MPENIKGYISVPESHSLPTETATPRKATVEK